MKNRPVIGPFRVERHDQGDGSITYEIWDTFTGTYHCVCAINDGYHPFAKHDAELIAKALNGVAASRIPQEPEESKS